MPHYFQPWNLAADGILGLVWTQCWEMNTAESVALGYVRAGSDAGQADTLFEGRWYQEEFPTKGNKGDRAPTPRFQAAAPDPCGSILSPM